MIDRDIIFILAIVGVPALIIGIMIGKYTTEYQHKKQRIEERCESIDSRKEYAVCIEREIWK